MLRTTLLSKVNFKILNKADFHIFGFEELSLPFILTFLAITALSQSEVDLL